MSDSGRDLLRRLLLVDYDKLKAQLARRLGSAERAGEALQDTWLRLESSAPIGAVERPQPYLLRIAYNIALKRRQAERETMTLDDARAALNLVDEAPDPERVVEAKSEAVALKRALAELSPRRRGILLASRGEGVPLSEIAVRYGLSQRMVEMELKFALIHCGRRLGRNIVQRFGPRPLNGSQSKKNHDL
jgi:RNA polymerase sigma-70 factor (ECF subfamily)